MSEPSLLSALVSYQARGVGVDMALKSVLGVFRLLMIYSKSKEDRQKYFSIVDSIIETRMIGNFGKPALTLYQGVQKFYSSVPNASHRTCAIERRLVLASTLFRTLEQLSGDLGFLQKVVIASWSRERLSFCYRFFKSISLSLSLLAECMTLTAVELKVRTALSCGTKCHQIAREYRLKSILLIVRTLCDLYVYFKWIPSYTPIPTIEFICGSISGLIGVWLVWKDQRKPYGQLCCDCGGSAAPA